MLLIGATWPFGGSHTRAPIGLYTEVPEWSSGVLRTMEAATRTERLLGSEPAGVPRRQQHISRQGRRKGTMWEWDGRSSVEKGRRNWKQCERAAKEWRSRSHRCFTELLLWQAGRQRWAEELLGRRKLWLGDGQHADRAIGTTGVGVLIPEPNDSS